MSTKHLHEILYYLNNDILDNLVAENPSLDVPGSDEQGGYEDLVRDLELFKDYGSAHLFEEVTLGEENHLIFNSASVNEMNLFINTLESDVDDALVANEVGAYFGHHQRLPTDVEQIYRHDEMDELLSHAGLTTNDSDLYAVILRSIDRSRFVSLIEAGEVARIATFDEYFVMKKS